jgi:hypothetical protein
MLDERANGERSKVRTRHIRAQPSFKCRHHRASLRLARQHGVQRTSSANLAGHETLPRLRASLNAAARSWRGCAAEGRGWRQSAGVLRTDSARAGGVAQPRPFPLG